MIEPGRGPLLWIGALALTLVVLGVDSCQRLESIRTISERRVSSMPGPGPDALSESGHVWGQHRAILPAIDGYHWILQTERMLSGGGWRIREVDYDDAPGGREVHWSGSLRWWSTGLAVVYRAVHPELTLPQALEHVTPWANTALVALLVLVVTPLIASRLGGVAAALFALGTVAVFPFYEYFVVGYFDHHGIATLAALLTVLCLAGGGAGWVGADPPPSRSAPTTAPLAWLPSRATARRWFVASALCGAIGLWVNAATVAPVLVGLGLGGLVATWLGRSGPRTAGWQTEPSLWRIWGWTGGAASLGFYLLEYFPSHLGMRLEVNHPLYALAWVAGGDLLARLGAPRAEDTGPKRTAWLALDALGLALVPALLLMLGERAFRLSDPFLYTLHQRFIIEFLPLGGQLATMSPRVIAGRASALPLLALLLGAALWPTGLDGRARIVWRGLLGLAMAVSLAFAHTVLSALLDGRMALVLAADAILLAVGFGLCLVRGERALATPTHGVLGLALAPALLLTGMALAQVRWVGVASALWIAVLVLAAAALVGAGFAWPATRRLFPAALLVVVFVVAPALFLPLPLDSTDPPQELARDASWWLRRRVGGDTAVVFTSPNATTWMAYFGGFPGVGTLYWENADGLEAATAIYTAPTPDSLRVLLERRRVTHVVLYPWDRGLELLRLAREATTVPAAQEPYLAAVVRALRTPGVAPLPPWLLPLPYPAPAVRVLGHPSAVILEVVPEQPRELTLLRLAEYHKAVGAPAETETALRASLEARPSAAAWAVLVQLEAARGAEAAAIEALASLRAALATGEALEVGDRVNAAIALAIGRDVRAAARELGTALAVADERALRRLPADQLEIVVRLARQLGLEGEHGETISIAERLIPR